MAKPPIKRVQKKSTAQPKPGSIAEIKDLISFINRSGLNEIKMETPELKLHIKRASEQSTSQPAIHPLPTAEPDAKQPTTPAPKEAETIPATASETEIRSPMIGTFYRSSNPDTPPFISVGDKIKKGQVLCIIEAMKLFNEIESEVSGTVVKILVENASPVEYDQPILLIEPN